MFKKIIFEKFVSKRVCQDLKTTAFKYNYKKETI